MQTPATPSLATPAGTYWFRTEPYQHQRDALERSWDEDGWGLLMEMGTGKSKIIIDTIGMLAQFRGLRRVLIVAPKGTYLNWPNNELPRHMPDVIAQITDTVVWRGGHTESERRGIRRLTTRGHEGIQILCMNIEALAISQKAITLVTGFVAMGDCLIIVDESSAIKNPQAMRTKTLIKLGRQARWRRIATGTPVTRSPLDLWSQFEFLRQCALGHKSFYSFRSRYAILENKYLGGRSIDVVVGHRDTEKLTSLVATMATVVRKEDCLDLPDKIYRTVDVEMTLEQRKIYEEMRQWATTELSGGSHASATQVITQLLRLHQVVCGHIVDEHGEVHDIPTNRVSALMDLVEETQGGRGIVWCSYRRDIDKVVRALTEAGHRAVRYDGSVSDVDRQEAVYRFQGRAAVIERGEVVGQRDCPDADRAEWFVGTPASGGYGLTLTAAKFVFYYSNNYDLEKRLQSEDRAHRIGQEDHVLYVDLRVPETVDDKIVTALKRKESLLDLVMSGAQSLVT